MGLIIDNFAGGGGASTGIVMGLGRHIDVAINHDEEAVAMHSANHPETIHLCQSVWKADPYEVVKAASEQKCRRLNIPFRMYPVDLGWFSPDCKHFSKAKGGKPVDKNIRDLAWVVVQWAKRLNHVDPDKDLKPRVILLENVEEFKDWGPLITIDDGTLRPCPERKASNLSVWGA